MRFTNLLIRPAVARTTNITPLADPTTCRSCTADEHHCHGTLVLHADGSAHCDEAHLCDGREDLHDWWVPCTDLGCGCTGDEHPRPMLLAAA